jgi:large conductance mechanosensitive channel
LNHRNQVGSSSPPIGLLLGNVTFQTLAVLKSARCPVLASLAQASGGSRHHQLRRLPNTISFLIVAFAVFLMIKGMNQLKRKQEAPAAAPTTKECPYCLSVVPIKATRCPHCTSELRTA